MLEVVNKLLQAAEGESNPYSFFLQEREVVGQLSALVDELGVQSEEVVQITYQPQAVFRVRAIARCSGTMKGHADNIIELYFSPDGKRLASGSGDCTVRFWDLPTQSPKLTCKGHSHWVQCIAWAPDNSVLASGGRDSMVRLWDPDTGKEICALKGHRQSPSNRINWIAWEPLHSAPSARCTRLASAGQDAGVKVWDYSRTGAKLVMSLGHHTKPVTCVKWGGEGLIYTASQDRTIGVWRAKDGALCRVLTGHAHWVNTLSLSTEYVTRTGPYNHRGGLASEGGSLKEIARKRYAEVVAAGPELLVSGSEDNTMYLWNGAKEKKPIAPRITGHQKGINHVLFSPCGRFFASGSFDKSAKVWEGRTGRFLGTLRGHVGPVFRVTWAPDSRYVVTASEDSTLKLWSLKTYKMVTELPGHSGSVYVCDWAPNGESVASGGADRTLKLWRR